MELASFSRRNGDFYVPAFVVRVGGKSLMDERAVAVSQVEVDLALSTPGRFSFTVVNTWDHEKREFRSGTGEKVLDILTFGASVEIAVGYGDRSRLPAVISGIVTEISTTFSESGTPELSVAGYDHLFTMTLGKRSQNWAKSSDSDVVQKIAKEYNLGTAVKDTKAKHPQIEQNQESDFDLIKKLATRNHFEFFVDPKKTLHFGPPSDDDEGVVTLNWGEGLLSFKPEANLASQVSAVEVYGWDPDTKEPIVGKAVAGEESGRDPRRKSGGERLRAALSKAPVLQVRQPVFTQAEAKERARSILNDHAKRFVTGEADCIGLPDVRPDRNVTLGNLGSPFSKTYYVEKTTHKVDGSGYRMKVRVKDVSI
jgi:Bacteriophage probable baseplate hub protein